MEHVLPDGISTLKLGKYAEYLVCAKLIAYNLDVYFPTLDDHGVDMIVRKGEGYHYDIQVKAKHPLATNPILFTSTFAPSDILFVAIVLFEEGKTEPMLYLVPSTEWRDPKPGAVFKKPAGRAGYRFLFLKGYQEVLLISA